MLDTDPPLWFIDVEDDRLELTTDELQNYKAFHKVCMERLFKCFRMMKQDSWLQVVSLAMRDAVRIDAPDEVGHTGQFHELLEDFVMDRHRGEKVDDLLSGRPWEDEETQRHYFRLKDLTKYLETAGFKIYNRSQIVTRIKSMGGNRHFFNIKNTGVNVWYVPSKFKPMPQGELPHLSKDPI